jgi:hypothetical protein
VLTPTPNCAAAAGADFINISSGQLTPAGEAQCILADAVRSCSRADKLIVAKPGPRGQPWSADNGGNCLVLQKTIIRPRAVATIVETTYFTPLLASLKCPRLSAIRTRWEIVRACIFCMTAAL